MASPENLDRQIVEAPAGDLTDDYVVAASAAGDESHQGGRLESLPYRAEATFDAASAIDGIRFKVQVSRTVDGVGDPLDRRWTDLALRTVADPAAADAVEWTILAALGATVPRELFCDAGHRGRGFLRVLVRKTGVGAAAGDDALRVWAPA